MRISHGSHDAYSAWRLNIPATSAVMDSWEINSEQFSTPPMAAGWNYSPLWNKEVTRPVLVGGRMCGVLGGGGYFIKYGIFRSTLQHSEEFIFINMVIW